jgi:hypothetical protein
MITKRWISILMLILMGANAFAQFSLSGEIRPRNEYRHGFQSLMGPDDKAAFFVSQRSRLNFGYNNPDLKVFVSLQDVRVWGDVPQLNRSDANSSIHEAWADLPLGTSLSLKVGRQEVVYDNSRIFGNVDWAQQGRSHDMALLKWNVSENINLHGGFAFNQESERRIGTFYGLTNYKTMQYAWLNIKPGNTSVSLLFLNLGFQHAMQQTVFNQTFGGYVAHNFTSTRINGAAYVQTGRDVSNRNLAAYYLGGELIQPLSETWDLTTGFEWFSGTDQQTWAGPNNSTNNSFSPYFGTNHRFNGHMDYFFVGNHFNNVGLRDLYLSFDYKREKWLAMIKLHGFWSDADVFRLNSQQQMNKFLGSEFDLMLGYNISPVTSLRMGYSQMFATETMERIKGGSKDEIQNWFWTMLVIKPKFI